MRVSEDTRIGGGVVAAVAPAIKREAWHASAPISGRVCKQPA